MLKNNQTGAISRILLILAVVTLVVILIVYIIVRVSTVKNSAAQKSKTTTTTTTTNPNTPPPPVYDTQIGNIKFYFVSAIDMGSVLKGTSYQPDLTTTERFI